MKTFITDLGNFAYLYKNLSKGVMKKKISILIPAYNEEKSLDALRSALVSFLNSDSRAAINYDYEVLVVNDGSTDSTEAILNRIHKEDSRFNYLSLSRNFGKENAMLAGFDFVTGDCCIIMDADLQDPVDVIPAMIEKWEEGYEDVYGKRLSRGKESWLRRKLTMTYYRILQNSTKFDILPNVGDFRLLDRRCIEAMRSLRETQRYTKGLFAWIGFKKAGIDFNRQSNTRRPSSFSLRSLMDLAIEGITSFTTAPLRIATVTGLIGSMLSFFYLIWIFVKTLIWGDPIQGFPTLMCTILLLGCLQLMALGIIGEYIGRIFKETKNRPVYIASTFNGEKLNP